jgi:hypothetical protein
VKLVMTLRTRDQADLVDALVSFHLNAGVDFVIATDHRSQDGTVEILEAYAREGRLHLTRELGEHPKGSEWRTRMARMAATDYGADWVINADGDEFWFPRGASLKEVLEPIPGRYGIVRAPWRQFLPARDEAPFFAERMTVRLSAQAPINDPLSPWRPQLKLAHRADPSVLVGRGNEWISAPGLVPLRGWYPIEVLHFPVRARAQLQAKYEPWTSDTSLKSALPAFAAQAAQQGRLEERYELLAPDEEARERGIAEGSLVVDTRLRDALRALRLPAPRGVREFALPGELDAPLTLPRPTVVDDAGYAVDVATVAEADLVRLERRLDELEQRVLAIGPPLWRRARRALRRR